MASARNCKDDKREGRGKLTSSQRALSGGAGSVRSAPQGNEGAKARPYRFSTGRGAHLRAADTKNAALTSGLCQRQRSTDSGDRCHLMGELQVPAQSLSRDIMNLHWVQELLNNGFAPVLTTGAMLSQSSDLPSDHMLTAFLRFNMLKDMASLYNPESQTYCSLYALGETICGHRTVVHGGFTSALIDDAFGGLVYILKREGAVTSGPSYTVHLEVDYKAPVQASRVICCTSQLIENTGRKAWVKATVEDQPGGTLHVTAKALFVVPRPESAAASLGWKGFQPAASEGIVATTPADLTANGI